MDTLPYNFASNSYSRTSRSRQSNQVEAARPRRHQVLERRALHQRQPAKPKARRNDGGSSGRHGSWGDSFRICAGVAKSVQMGLVGTKMERRQIQRKTDRFTTIQRRSIKDRTGVGHSRMATVCVLILCVCMVTTGNPDYGYGSLHSKTSMTR